MLKNFKWSSMLLSIVYSIGGLIMFMRPGDVADFICYIIGIALILYGLIDVMTYFLIELKESLFRNEFSHGIILILLGILVIWQRSMFQQIIPFILGIMLIGSGFSKVQDGIDAGRIGSKHRWVYIVFGLVSVVLGIIVMLNRLATQDLLFRMIGASLIYSGLTDLYFSLYLSGKIRKWNKENELLAMKENGPVVDVEEVENKTTTE